MQAVDLTLAMDYGSEDMFTQAIEADEGFALAHAGLAFTLMLRPEDARASAQRASSLAGCASRRERKHIEAIALFVNGQGPQSLALAREHLDEFPRDAFLLRLALSLHVSGCSGGGVSDFPPLLLGLLRTVESDYGDDWAFLSQYAFAHHENGLLEDALQLAERSLSLGPSSNAFASHAVAHVFFERGEHAKGQDFLGNWLTTYDKRAPFRVHLSWHHALFELAMGRYQRARELYETDIRPAVVAKNAASLNDSASLLWRMHIYGGGAPQSLIEEVRDLAAPTSENPTPAFAVAHAALAFAAAGDESAMGRLTDGLQKRVEKGDPLAAQVMLPLVRGIGAFADGDYDRAVGYIEPILGQLTRIGGSHAQREVFDDTLVAAYLRAEQFDKARRMLRERLKQRLSVRDEFWLGCAQAGGGQHATASGTIRKAVSHWQAADPGSPEIA